MTLVSLTGLLASLSGVLMALSPLLQARRVHAVRDSSEVSAAMFIVIGGNAAVWLAHGVATSDLVLVVPNVVAVVASAVTVTVVHRHRHGPAALASATVVHVEAGSFPGGTREPAGVARVRSLAARRTLRRRSAARR
jgi:uncharacterized protein with PQ loop repeat